MPFKIYWSFHANIVCGRIYLETSFVVSARKNARWCVNSIVFWFFLVFFFYFRIAIFLTWFVVCVCVCFFFNYSYFYVIVFLSSCLLLNLYHLFYFCWSVSARNLSTHLIEFFFSLLFMRIFGCCWFHLIYLCYYAPSWK